MRSVRRLGARQDEPQAALVMQDWYGRIRDVRRLRLAGGDSRRPGALETPDRLPDGDEDRLLAEPPARIDRREGH